MNELEKFVGIVSQGFVGNIQYNMELKDTYQELRILLTYDKEKCTNPSAKLMAEMKNAYEEYCSLDDFSLKAPQLLSQMKTEIQICAFLNGEFIGNIHMPGTKKEMLFSPTEISPGCISPKTLQGHLKVVINFFQVICDDTRYELKIYGK